MDRLFAALLCSMGLLTPSLLAQTQNYADQVKTIQNDQTVKIANDYLDKNHDPILKEWIAITEINAPSGHEEKHQDIS